MSRQICIRLLLCLAFSLTLFSLSLGEGLSDSTDTPEWLTNNLQENIPSSGQDELVIYGRSSLLFRLNSVNGEGGSTAYRNQYWDTNSFDQQSDIFITGPILPNIYIDARWHNSRFSRSSSDFRLSFKGGDGDVVLGSIPADLGSNRFLSLNRQLKGLSIKGGNEELKYSLFASRTKGTRRTETFPGDDSPGPYLLRYTPILDGSEVVKVDEETKRRGEDYTIDYYAGLLTFEVSFGGQTQTTIIPSTSTISVSYEQQRGDSREGILYGLTTKARLNERVILDASYLAQVSEHQPAEDTGSVKRVEEFYGSGSPGPFRLSYRPIDLTQPILVYVDDNLKQEGLDYHFRPEEGYIEFTTNISPFSIVRVEYYQIQERISTAGDLRILGLATTLNLTPTTNINLQYAHSMRDGGTSGSALGLYGNSQLLDGRLNLSTNLTNVSPHFSRFNSVGFQRDTKGYNFTADFKVNDYIRASTFISNDKSNTGLNFGYDGFSSAQTDESNLDSYEVNTSRKSFDLSFDFPNLPSLRLQRNIMSNESGFSGQRSLISDQASLDYALGEFSASARIGKIKQRFDSSSLEEESDDSTDGSTTTTKNLTLSWFPSEKFSLSTNLSANNTTDSTGTGQKKAKTSSLRATYYVNDALTLTLRRSISNSSGNLFSDTESSPITLSRDELENESDLIYQNVRLAYGLTYSPNPDFSASLFLNQNSYLNRGSNRYLSDRDSNDLTFNFYKGIGDYLSLDGNFSQQRLSYLGEGGSNLSTKMLRLGLRYDPDSKRSGRLDYQLMKSQNLPLADGASEPETTKISSLSARFNYHLANDDLLSSSLRLGNISGVFDNSRKLEFITEYNHPINKLLATSLQFKHIRYNALGEQLLGSGGDYTANSLSASLTANFR